MRPLQQTISCLTQDVLVVTSGGGANRRPPPGQVHAVTLANGPIEIVDDMNLDVGLMYEVVKVDDPTRGPYKVRTRGYDYTLRRGDRDVVIAYHWHPSGQSSHRHPHFHAPASYPGRIHFPCDRTSLEEVVRLCISELGAKPRREDWQSVLTMNQDKFELFRSWPPQPRMRTTLAQP